MLQIVQEVLAPTSLKYIEALARLQEKERAFALLAPLGADGVGGAGIISAC